MTLRVGYIVGSLSKVSINRKLAAALVQSAPKELEMVEIPIANLPLYNHDFDVDYPPEGLALKAALDSVDGLLFVTPEYNRSIPGALKNAIDWATRPWGTSALAGKPVAVIGASIGAIGSAVGQQHLRNILAFTDSPLMGQPEGYISYVEGLISEGGVVSDPETKEFLLRYMTAFHRHIARVLPAAA